MAETRLCVGFSSACKQARGAAGCPATRGEPRAAGRFLRPFLPPDLVRLIDALVRRLKHEDALLSMNGGELGHTLCDAAAAGGLLDVRFLLARGADVEQTTAFVNARGDEFGWTALMWAAWFGHLAVSATLLDAGTGGRDWALYAASMQGHTAIVALLLDRGADIHFQYDNALVNAAQVGHLAAATLLLDRGADIHAQEDRPLIMATQEGHIEIVRLLLDRGADFHARDDRPLQVAACNGHLETVRLLLDRGADVHSRDEARSSTCRTRERTDTPPSWRCCWSAAPWCHKSEAPLALHSWE